MKIQFKDQEITASGIKWIVSGYWDTDISQVKLTRIEGNANHEGIGEACYNLAIDKGWL